MNRSIVGYILALVILFCTLVAGNVQAADPLDNWHWKNPIPQGNALRGVSFGSNKFVAVGDYGTILTSTDLGINWNNRTALNSGSSGTRENLRAVAFGNMSGSTVVSPGFVAVGDNGTIIKSKDGNSWMLDSTSGITANLHSVAYGVDATSKQSFVAVGANGTAIRSYEGTSWKSVSNAKAMTGEMLNGIAYGAVPNTFVTVSNNGNIYYSIDNGDNWTKSPDSNSSRPLKGVSFVNGNFIAVGAAGAIISSANGVSWVVQASGTAADLNAVTYGDTYVVVGNLSYTIVATSGFTTWAPFPALPLETPSNYNIFAVTNDGDKTYIAVGEYGEILRYTWNNPVSKNWLSQRNDIVFNTTSKSSSDLYGIAFGAENFVAVGNNNTISLLGNGSLLAATGNFRAAVYADNSFMAVGAFGAEGAVYKSDTVGASWTGPLKDAITGNSIASSGLYAITYGNGTVVAAGLSGKLLTYSGNVYNNSISSGVTTHLRAAAFGNGIFVVAGDNGAVITSGDANTWTVRNSGITTQINALSYGNGRFVAVGAGGVILISTDNGVSWQSVASPTTGNLYGVAYGNGVFAAVGEDAVHGTIFTSSDYGSTWSSRPSGTANALYAVAFGKGQFYVSGRFGTVIMSDTVSTAPATVTATTPADGATGVPVDSPITVTFSANMNGGTIDGTSFKIVPAVTGATINYDSANFRATLAHAGKLAYGTNYTATLTTTILDASGNALPVGYSWQFTTAQAPDISPPEINSAIPASGATDVSITTLVQVTFKDFDVNPLTINSNTFKLTPNVAGNVTFDGLTATFTPTPPATLTKGVEYTSTVTTGVKDMVGNSMAVPYIWKFTTHPATHTVALTVGANGSVVSNPITATSPVTSSTLDANSIATVSDTGSAIFSITPDPGYHLSGITVDGTSVILLPTANSSGVYAYTLSNIIAPKRISFSFAVGNAVNFTITANTGAKAIIQDDTSNQLVNLTLFGVSTSNTDNNTLYWTLTYGNNYNYKWVCDSQGLNCSYNYAYCDAQGLNCYYSTRACSPAFPCPELSLFKGQTRQTADLVARGQMIFPSGSKPSGMITLVPQNNSGLSGYVDVEEFSKDDTNSLNKVNITVDNGGSITPYGIISIAAGASQSFEIAPVQGYSVYDLKIGTPPVSLFTKAGRQAVITSFAVDLKTPSTMYQGTGSGLYKSIDSGSSWKLISNGNGISDTRIRTVVIDPVNSNTLYTGTEAGIFKSVNGGGSWVKINSAIGGATVNTIVIDTKNTDIIYIGTPGGVFKSSTGGTSWTISNSGLNSANVNSLVIDPVSSDTVYAATLGGVYKSTDSGASWIAMNTSLDDLSVNSIIIDPTRVKKIFIGTNNGVYSSNDAAGTWQASSSGLPDTGVVSALAFDSSNTSTLYAGTLAGVFMSKDSGLSWLAKYNGFSSQNSSTTNALAMSPTAIYAGTINGSYKSTDKAESWVMLNKTFTVPVENVTSDKTLVVSFGIDTTPPTVISTLPKKNAKNVDPLTTVSVTFSESMLSSSINTNTFLVKDSLGNSIIGTVALDASGTIATFTLPETASFRLGSTYTAIITAGATDQSANPLFAQYSWSFNIHSAIHAIKTSVANGTVTSVPVAVDNIITVSDTANAVLTIKPAVGNETSSYKLESIYVDGVAVINLPTINVDGTYTYKMLNVINDQTFTASFVLVPKIKYTVFVIPNSDANITALPALNSAGTVVVSDGDSVTLTFKPKVGYALASLTDNVTDYNLVNPPSELVKDAIAADGTNTWIYTISGVKADRTIKATFSNAYTIGVSSGVGGSVSPGNTTVSYGSSQLFTIKPDAGYKLASLTVDNVLINSVDIINSTYRMENITANKLIHAEFIPYSYMINIATPELGTGSVTVTSRGVYLDSGDKLSISIVPARGYELDTLIYDDKDVKSLVFAGTYTTPAVTKSATLSATFKLIKYYLVLPTVLPNGKLTVNAPLDASTGKPFIYYGGSATFTVIPDKGVTPDKDYILKDMTLDGVSIKSTVVNNTYTLSNITADHTVAAEFKMIPTVTSTSVGSGSISPTGVSVAPANGSLTYTFKSDTGYQVSAITVDGDPVTSLADSYTFTDLNGTNNKTDKHTINVAFDTKKYIVKSTATATSNGTTTLSTATVDYDGSVDIVVTPGIGYKVSDIKIKSDAVGSSDISVKNKSTETSGVFRYTLTKLQNNYEITATFEKITYQVVTTAGNGGTISPISAEPKYGDLVTFTISPQDGYSLQDITLDGNSVKSLMTDNRYILKDVAANHTIAATFVVITKTITASVNDSTLGSITPVGVTTVNYGANQKYTITAAAGSVIDDLLVGGVSYKSQIVNGTYTCNSVKSDQVIVANFKLAGTAVSTTYPDGDINLDGKVDNADALLALQMSVGLFPQPTAEQMKLHSDVGPVNAQGKPQPDGKIDIDDVVVLLQRVVGNLAW